MGGGRGWVGRWWRGEGGALGSVADVALWPAELAFRTVVAGRNAWYGRTPPAPTAIPVISVGNLTVGGTGKTPVTAWLAGRLAEAGRRPAVIVSGYGADEVALHRELNPAVAVIVAAKRAEGVVRAAREGADCALMDDAFQHRALARRLELVLIAAEQGASGRMLPRGPFREPASALERADFVLVTRKTASREAAEGQARSLAHYGAGRTAIAHISPTGIAPLRAREAGEAVEPVEGIDTLAGRDILAVSSIARPEAFAGQLGAAGSSVELLAYPDHHPYDERDVAEIVRRARGRAIVTTRKDAVKLRGRIPPNVEAWVVEQEVRIESGQEGLDRAVEAALAETG